MNCRFAHSIARSPRVYQSTIAIHLIEC